MVALADIQAYAHEIARRFKPQKIILFGSHASGEPDEDSDVDLLVVMPDGGDPIERAVEIRCAVPRCFPLDLIVRSPEDLHWRLAENDCFTREIVEKRQNLYEAQHR